MIQVPRHIQMKPFVARQPRFATPEVGHPDEERPAGTEDTLDFRQDALWRGHMFQYVPQDYRIELSIREMRAGQISDMDRQPQSFPSVSGGGLTQFRALRLPATFLKLSQQKTWTAANIQDAPGAIPV